MRTCACVRMMWLPRHAATHTPRKTGGLQILPFQEERTDPFGPTTVTFTMKTPETPPPPLPAYQGGGGA